ncbi:MULTISPECIES: NAD-dependent DNA ligase LigA [unclassified Streptomyces]|uniref:NAD-dependent DNA ligase LigA n=1 Tax=unclassified Streptomyces TaxID=2593676 RepID=UPI00114FF337|nr:MULTISPECIES: NAD-dependent DNA ligase LigA [unclassified Streptomyces]MCX5370141.1 NAD-dependent DNA ligase LigA [Streptomyces sp. NBC_00103]TQJ52835.1 DNA ligase (NAD+) [Streptomyces sp. SLBN-115]
MTDTTSSLLSADAYADAVATAVAASAAYYTDGSTALGDDEYDALLRAITAYEDAHPSEVLPDSPTGKVAGGAVQGDVPHSVPMLSLDNVFDATELTDWAASLERRLGRPMAGWCVEPKLDGLAMAARYQGGKLVQMLTRGDGLAGEDITHAATAILGLPAVLSEPIDVELRGEVLLTTAQFEEANRIRIAHEAPPFAHPRSGAAGTLRAKDRPYRIELTFFAYDAIGLDFDLAHSALLDRLAALGAHTAASTAAAPLRCETLEAAQQRIDEIAALRAALPFGIDGVVVKADTAADRHQAGSGSRAPRWAVARKLAAEHKVTRLLEVEWNVGRTGIIAPRAVLEPVVIDGVTVTYATLHNPADITRRDLMLGDLCYVFRAGDVIPRVEAPLADQRDGSQTPVVFPTACPRCGDEIDTSEQRWRCVRGRNCQAVASVIYAAGRDQLDIEGLGHTRAVQLVESGLVTDIADLFTLTRDQLLGLDRMGETSTDNLLAALETARSQPLNRVFCALGVRGTGRTMSRRIAAHFGSLAAIRAADADALAEVPGIGTEKARVVAAELRELAPLLDKLTEQEVGTHVTKPQRSTTAEAGADAEAAGNAGPLAGEAVVVTGSMTGVLAALSRNEMNELIERAGGKASSSVSKRTTLLVVGEKAGSKRTKAEELGIRVLAPEDFATLVIDHLPQD